MKLNSFWRGSSAALWPLLLLTLACGPSEPGSESAPTGPSAGLVSADPGLVLAEDRLGPVTWGELDAYVVQLPPASRWPQGVDPQSWYRQLIRRVAVDRLLADEAELLGVDQEAAFTRLERQIRRVAYSDAFMAQQEAPAPPSREDIAALYERNKARYQQAERRRVLNIFKRFGDGGPEVAVAALESIRERVLAGEPFDQLARTESDSETRHRGGELGFVERGRFSDDFDGVVFGLEAEVPSEVVKTADGAHLFYVANILEERSLALEDVEPLLRQELALSRRLERLRTVAAALPIAAEARVATPERLRTVLGNRQQQGVILELGDYRMTAGELVEQVRTLGQQMGGRQPPEFLQQVFSEMTSREIILQHVLADESFETPEELIEVARRRQLLDYFSKRKLEVWLEQRPDLVQAHYESERMRFATPPRLDVTRLLVPGPSEENESESVERWTRLEEAVPALDAGTLDLAALAAEVGGELTQLEALTPRQLAAQDPGSTRFATLLDVGEHSPPYSTGDGYALFRVDKKQDPQPRPLPLVRDAVIGHLVETQGAQLFRQMTDELLEEASFALNEENLAQLFR